MATCISCGHDVTGKKFCPECGTPVQPTGTGSGQPSSENACPRCNGTVKPGAAFCMHCGSSLSAQVTSPTAQSQPLTRTCVACHTEVAVGNAFCTNCGQSMQPSATPPAPAASAPAFCTNCGRQNTPGVKFCSGCGSPIAASPTPQPAYGQPAYNTQYPQYQQLPQPYGQPQYPQQYGQMGYQPEPMMGQPPMALRCPVCMAMAPMGTPNCLSCHTSLAGVVPTPSNVPMQQGGFGGPGGFMQGDGGKYAMGALGGAAAVIGGEMLLHGMERDRYRDGDDGPLGGLGNIANDIGLF